MTTITDHITTDVHDMLVVHRVFRRELVVLPQLIRATSAGDRLRARAAASQVDLILDGLHIHHTGEDAVLWPLLRERTANIELLDTMEAQHAGVAAGVAAAADLVEEWSLTAGSDVGLRLAAVLEQLATDLMRHLDHEERELLPLAAWHLSPAEWKQVGAHGRNTMTLRQLPLMFGAILEDADDAERAATFAEVPFPVRWYLRTIGARRYRRHIERVRGRG